MKNGKTTFRQDRRKFLVGAAATGIAGAMTVNSPPSEATGRTNRGRQALPKIDWQEMIGERFYLCGSPFDETARMAVLVLREVEQGSHSPDTELPPGVRRQWCSLVFEVAGEDPVASATHIVEHPILGRFPAFVNSIPDPRVPFANLCEIGFG